MLYCVDIRERKAELFDRAMSWIFGQLEYDDRFRYEETLEEIGFTDEEISEQLSGMFDEESAAQ